jgi:hypothetical protein
VGSRRAAAGRRHPWSQWGAVRHYRELIYQLRAAPGASHRLHIHRGNSSGIVEVDGGNLDDIQFRLQTSPAS